MPDRQRCQTRTESERRLGGSCGGLESGAPSQNAEMSRHRSSKQEPEAAPDAWRRVAEIEKELLQWPTWSSVAAQERADSTDELSTSAADTVYVRIPLGETCGPGLEGVFLRLNALAYRREFNVTATLEFPGGRSWITIARVDGWPSAPHVNIRARGHPALRRLPAMVEGHHVHRFADNARLGRSAFEPPQNLPVAVPVNESIQSFRDFLRIVAKEFHIAPELDRFDSPDSWELLI